MKKAFTLVELLVVVVVIVTLMTITFKLAGAGGDSTARNITINRMQRLENCLSGYYAAYGSYPPVQLHGSRDYTYKAEESSYLQAIAQDERIAGNLSENWVSVNAACRSQPLDFAFPFNDNMRDYVEAVSQLERDSNPSATPYTALTDNGTVSTKGKAVGWSQVQIFKFGVMSYLLPRYLVAMKGSDGSQGTSSRTQLFTAQKSWTENNQLPCQFETGAPYPDWSGVYSDVNSEPWKVAALPSQAATARWLPNLSGICSWLTSRELYGVDIRDHDDISIPPNKYSPGGYSNTSQSYKLERVTVKDGWGNVFYYYSVPPHQSYTLWSSGPNGRTFPPWVPDEERNAMSAADRQTVQTWVGDDLMHMSN